MDSLLRLYLAVLLAFSLVGSCDNTVDAVIDNDRYIFSIFGFLDAAADTQWIRVMPVRDSLLLSDRPIDATVTIESLDDGELITMNDSLFRYGASAYAHNFWTTDSLQPEGTYRFTASRSDGRSSTATVTFPPDFPPPDVLDLPQEFNPIDYIYIYDVERLAYAVVVYRMFIQNEEGAQVDSSRTVRVSQLDDITKTNYGFEIKVNPVQDTEEVRSRLGLLEIRLQPLWAEVAAAGSDWPDYARFDEEDLALPDGVTNIENGVGYLAPIIRKRAPYE